RRLLLTRTLLDANPAFPFLRLTTNDAASDYHSAQLHFRRRLSSGLQSFASYTFAKSLDDLSPDTAARALLGSDDRRMERGPSDFDVRHAFVGLLSYELPAAFNSGVGRALLRDWTLDALFNARSARPVNVLYAVPTSYGFAYLRPDLIAGVPLYVEDPSVAGGRRINPAAFAAPTHARQGTLARNGLRGFPVHQFDLGLRRRFAFNERVSLLLRAEAFNLFNHPNFEDPSGEDATLGTLSLSDASPRPNATFGRSHSARGTTAAPGYGFGPFHSTGGPRTFRFSLKLVF
ncbi:MAG TPA: hypothetical protein VEQ42_07565, partial [Pyrinomonadaceae bacterium]|nr:hypothetical protein [Pyrinomonadaceae bacterium]